MTPAKNTKADIEARARRLVFPRPDDWKDIVRDLKLTEEQAQELKFTIQQVLANIRRYQARPQRVTLVSALKRLEKALSGVQYEMARSPHLMNDFLPHKTLEFIGTSFTFTAIAQAVGEDVVPIDPDGPIQSIVERNNFVTMADLEGHFNGDRMALGHKYGGEILKNFIDVIHADLKAWVEADRGNRGGHPADIYRQYMIQRLAARAPWIIGEEATTTAKGKFVDLCVAVLNACEFSSEGIEKAIPVVLEKMNGKSGKKKRKRKVRSKRKAKSKRTVRSKSGPSPKSGPNEKR
jgi:hypothetical protein